MTNITYKFYYWASIAKIILGLFIVFITYTSINVYEDPAIAVSLGFIGIFIGIRGISFYLFLRGQKLFRKTENIRMLKDSYKLSLLFGIYIVINILLLMLGGWNKFRGILLLGGFILIQILLLESKYETNDEK
ncbi:MAG: hypothetical protein M0P94_02040 [Candidatus Absconditabacterales bacterium]|nr:hypothetical protein [Candidatus Absconditabacterales bacterium]